MSAAHGERIVCAGARTAKPPRLSVLTPFYKYDPSELIARLAPAPADVELILLDDGSNSAALAANVISALEKANIAARLIIWRDNGGRAAARNRLLEEARGEYVLFLDADMLPDSARFLHAWLGVIQTQRPEAAFGGLSLTHADVCPETALHHDLFASSDCAPAYQRERKAAQSVASANLLVRRAFLNQLPFDNGFIGWGFEDTDWALTAARHTPILHVDNPATHAGLDDVETLMRKSAEAGPNFARLAAKHPQVKRFSAHRIARALQFAPMRAQLRNLFAWLARDPMGAAPMRVRRVAFKLYRASHYAEHLA
jgi:hypothetical protein